MPTASSTKAEVSLKPRSSIGHVSLHYRALITSAVAADRLDLMRAQPEDRFVSAFLDPSPYAREPPTKDRVADVIAVLRISSSRSNVHRLSDGMRTVAVVDGDGLMVDLVDIEEWAAPYADRELPVPCSQRFAAHCRTIGSISFQPTHASCLRRIDSITCYAGNQRSISRRPSLKASRVSTVPSSSTARRTCWHSGPFCVTTRISARSLPREDGRRPLSPLHDMGTC